MKTSWKHAGCQLKSIPMCLLQDEAARSAEEARKAAMMQLEEQRVKADAAQHAAATDMERGLNVERQKLIDAKQAAEVGVCCGRADCRPNRRVQGKGP